MTHKQYKPPSENFFSGELKKNVLKDNQVTLIHSGNIHVVVVLLS